MQVLIYMIAERTIWQSLFQKYCTYGEMPCSFGYVLGSSRCLWPRSRRWAIPTLQRLLIHIIFPFTIYNVLMSFLCECINTENLITQTWLQLVIGEPKFRYLYCIVWWYVHVRKIWNQIKYMSFIKYIVNLNWEMTKFLCENNVGT